MQPDETQHVDARMTLNPETTSSAASTSLSAKSAEMLFEFLAGLAATAPLAPLLMIASTVGVFITGDGDSPVWTGFLVGVAGWLVMGFVARSFTRLERANRSVYRELTTRVTTLDAERRVPTSRNLALQLNALMRDLKMPGQYIDVDREYEAEKTKLLNELRLESARPTRTDSNTDFA